MKNYYQIMGVSPKADAGEIRKAYKKLAKAYHPDAAGNDPQIQNKMYELQEAYQVLGDPDKRRQYDEKLASAEKRFETGFNHHGKQKTEEDACSAEDIRTRTDQFERFFGFQAGKGMETYRDKRSGRKPNGPVKPEEMFASFFKNIR